jgi:hypothetical protein
MDWYTIEAPDWFLGEGWAITPETAGIAKEDGRGPGIAPVSGWIRRWREPLTLMIGGRNLTTAGTPAAVHVAIDGAAVADFTAPAGFFLHMADLPASASSGGYAVVTVASDNRDLAVEQFDAQPSGRLVFGFGEGWHEQEYNPTTGALWRWSSDRAGIRVRGAAGRRLALTLRGELEEAATSHVTIRVGDRVLAQFDVGASFERTALLPADAFSGPESTIVIESSAWYVPAEKRWRSGDRRRLALKLSECRLAPVS